MPKLFKEEGNYITQGYKPCSLDQHSLLKIKNTGFLTWDPVDTKQHAACCTLGKGLTQFLISPSISAPWPGRATSTPRLSKPCFLKAWLIISKLVSLAVRVDQRFRAESRRERAPPAGKPLSLVRPRRTLYFWGSSKSRGSAVGKTGANIRSHPPPLPSPLHVQLLLPSGPETTATFIDSGADANFIDTGLATQLGVPREPLPQPISASALDRHLLGTVTHQTTPVSLRMSRSHLETLRFHIISSPQIGLLG